MVDRYRDPAVDATYTSDDLKALALDPTIERELNAVLRSDHWPFGSGNESTDGSWSFEIADRVMGAAKAGTVDDLLAIRFGDRNPSEEELNAATPISSPPLIGGGVPTVDADEPIADFGDDLLDRVKMAKALASQATAQVGGGGFVVGITGPWGCGKTSLLNLIENAIDETNSGYVIRFDPWLFSSSEELVLRFLREISAQLASEPDESLTDVALRLSDYAQIIAPLGALITVPFLAPLAPILASSTKLARFKKSKEEAKPVVSAADQRAKVLEALKGLDRRLVVLIDDLDRLQAQEIRDVVRLVKLVADFPNTTYVLAYDQMKVAAALEPNDLAGGLEYLEKIVQLSHDVPRVGPEQLSKVLGNALNEAVGDVSRYQFDADAYTNLFNDGVQSLFRTVRDVRRYTNVLPTTLALVGDEVELADVLALEALRVRLPTSFSLIAPARDALTTTSQLLSAQGSVPDAEAKQQIEAIIDAAGSFAPEARAIIRRLFPATQRHFGGSHFGSEWLGTWRRTLRVANPEVLDIYLNKALPPGVLSANLVKRAFLALVDRQALSNLLDSLDSEELEAVLDRLEEYENEFPTEGTEVAVSLLYKHRRRLRTGKRHVFDLGADHKVARVVLRILRRLEPSEVARLVRQVLPEIPSFSDSGDLVRMVGYREDSGSKLVSETDASALETELIGALLAADAGRLAAEPDLIRLIYWARAVEPDQTAITLKRLIADDDFLVALLRSATREYVSQTPGEAAVRRRFELSWDALTALVPEPALSERVEEVHRATDLTTVDAHTAEALTQAIDWAAAANGEQEETTPDQ